MNLKSEEVLQRMREKIPMIEKFCKDVWIGQYGMLHLDIVHDGGLKQFVAMFERSEFLEPATILRNRQIFADVYIKINDEILYQLAVKEISIEDAIKACKIYGDMDVWKYQLEGLRKILPNEHFKLIEEKINHDEEEEEEVGEGSMEITKHVEEEEEKEQPEVPKEFEFLQIAFDKYKSAANKME